MSKSLVALICSGVVLAGLIWLVSSGDAQPNPNAAGNNGEGSDGTGAIEITFYCASSNRAVVDEIVQAYEKETGRRVVIQDGPSQTLLSQLEIAGSGDLYLPADDSFLQLGRDKGLIRETLPVARMQAGLAVPKGNPLQITSLQDAIDKEAKIVQANPEAAAVAILTKKILTASGQWESLDKTTTAQVGKVTEVANNVMLGSADVGIVYDAVLHTYPDLEFIEVPELAEAASEVAIGVLDCSKNSAAAFHFARYLTAADRGLQNYAEHSFRTHSGDAWADVPELSLFAGSMLRPAIEETIVEFEKREGVRVTRVYNGCGILVGQMKGGQHPDAYFACDKEFMNQVTDLFPESVDVSQNELVILVQKGNPQNVTSLRDLTREELRVGIGHEKQCAMGWITQNVLSEDGIKQDVMPYVDVEAATGDLLVNKMLAGSLDVAVVYLSNAAGAADKLDAIQIQGIACSTATQPWAVAQESKHPQLASRLFEQICSAESQEIFAAEGFRWELAE